MDRPSSSARAVRCGAMWCDGGGYLIYSVEFHGPRCVMIMAGRRLVRSWSTLGGEGASLVAALLYF